jgi:S-adenosylmethionine:tRNA ribosyltransferase-isomerase
MIVKRLADLKEFDYKLPARLVALTPSKIRREARLLVYDRKKESVEHKTFADLPNVLPPRSLIVFNDTKVYQARLPVRRQTGALSQLLFIELRGKKGVCLSSSKKVRVGDRLIIATKNSTPVFLKVLAKKEGGHYEVALEKTKYQLKDILKEHGEVPLPPYLKDSPVPEKKRRECYQTIFGKEAGSIAAPTASLHFDQVLLKKLRAAGHHIAFVTLHVGLGTFAPLSQSNLITKTLHTESYSIAKDDLALIRKAHQDRRSIVAVGTTVLRVLETVAPSINQKTSLKGETDIFIKQPYRFKLATSLVTNFHVPRSSLLLLIDAFLGKAGAWRLIYNTAIARKYRFYSFGDGMVIL